MRLGTIPLCGAALAIVVLAGCGTNSAAKGTSTPRSVKPTPTVIPDALAAYSSYADPILRTSIGEARGLISAMEHGDLTLLGDQCSLTGQDLASERTAFKTGSYVPSRALAAYKSADQGYKLVLSATDECGMAADAGSRKAMKPAISDLKNGLGMMQRSESQLYHWQGGKV